MKDAGRGGEAANRIVRGALADLDAPGESCAEQIALDQVVGGAVTGNPHEGDHIAGAQGRTADGVAHAAGVHLNLNAVTRIAGDDVETRAVGDLDAVAAVPENNIAGARGRAA